LLAFPLRSQLAMGGNSSKPTAVSSAGAAVSDGRSGLGKQHPSQKHMRASIAGKLAAVIAFAGKIREDDTVGPMAGEGDTSIALTNVATLKKAKSGLSSGKGSPSKGFANAAALGAGSAVMKDPPRNVFGPGFSVSPDSYPEFHMTPTYDRFLLAFEHLSDEERLSCFETMAFFQGKMGLVLRQCDAFCQEVDLLGLFTRMRSITQQVLQLPYGRLWEIDEASRTAVCIYNNSDDDAQNGRSLPLLGSFPGDVLRNGRREGKALVCNAVGADARFGSWQYREMQETMGEPLGVIVGVPLLAPGTGTAFVYEAYGGDAAQLLDLSDAFLLSVVGGYAASAADSILTRCRQSLVVAVPSLISGPGYLSSVREFVDHLKDLLCASFNAEEAQVFLATEKGGSLALRAFTPSSEGYKSGAALYMEAQQFDEFLVGPSDGIASRVAYHGGVVLGDTYVVNTHSTKNDKSYREEMDGDLPTILTAAIVNPKQTASSSAHSRGLVAVVQLRGRRWRPLVGAAPESSGPTHTRVEEIPKATSSAVSRYSGFTARDVDTMIRIAPTIAQAIGAAFMDESTRLAQARGELTLAQMDAITRMMVACANHTPLSELFPQVVSELTSLLDCDRATMWVKMPGSSTLYSMVSPYPPRPGTKLIRVEVPITESSVVGRSVVTSQPSNVKDAYDDPSFDQKWDKKTGYRTRSLLTLPLLSPRGGFAHGCVQCLNKLSPKTRLAEGESFSDADVRLASNFCEIVAYAIDLSSTGKVADSAVDMAVKGVAASS